MAANVLDTIAAQLEHYSLEEAIALIRAFLADLDEEQRRRFLLLVQKGPRPLVAESMGLWVLQPGSKITSYSLHV